LVETASAMKKTHRGDAEGAEKRELRNLCELCASAVKPFWIAALPR
jgi:hypothetical protein